MGLFSGVIKTVKKINSTFDPILGDTVNKVGDSVVGGLFGGDKEARTAEEAQLQFAQQQYADWKNVYGPIQDNLSAYYSTLTPDYYETIGLENFERERNNAMNDLDTYLAQQGLSDSGAALQLRTDANLSAAAERAKIRRDAPQMVAQEKMNFLSIGMNANPAPSVANVLSQQAASARDRANTAAAATGQAVGAATQTVGTLLQTGLSSYFGDNNAAK